MQYYLVCQSKMARMVLCMLLFSRVSGFRYGLWGTIILLIVPPSNLFDIASAAQIINR